MATPRPRSANADLMPRESSARSSPVSPSDASRRYRNRLHDAALRTSEKRRAHVRFWKRRFDYALPVAGSCRCGDETPVVPLQSRLGFRHRVFRGKEAENRRTGASHKRAARAKSQQRLLDFFDRGVQALDTRFKIVV